MGRVALAAIVSSWVILVTVLVNRVVPDPYMDEIFHIPQAQQYCKGNFRSWDPMITTPPGLYYLSLAQVASLFGFYSIKDTSSFSDLCSSAILRSVNGVLAVICCIILYDVITHLKPTLDDRKKMLQAVVLSLYPLHWFFTFLYYTDVASLTAVMAMYLASLKRNYWFSALIGAFSVVIRQTNIIWVLFVACTGILDYSPSHRKGIVGKAKSDVCINNPSSENSTGKSNVGLYVKKRKSVKSVDTVESSLPRTPVPTFASSGLVNEVQTILLMLWHKKWEILVLFSPYLLVFVAFILFVRWNGGVVLGAKEAHTVTPHFAQILYFGLVSILALAPMYFSIAHSLDLLHLLRRIGPLCCFFQGFVALIAGFLSVHFFSVAHPYLLADNRHYPFYLWRKIIMAHWSIKYLLVPIYLCSWLSIIHMLGRFQRKIWVLAYFLATAAVLVPAPLIEFRYYTIPFYFLVLHSNFQDSGKWFLTGILYIGVNIFTMMMFLFRPFHWDHEPGTQRFIW
ncbi:dol-P-Glc:Glc(2)Man(9)GlcNAc(2)-PP-Dol alpha-1,2-glucosyltransferase isoform X1 [Arachis stenosperma]|uniref:dol-P-Glc:Glc(2)Man(9)GlcNAc(2)-PP-Dol alpha-1,2-glucosyltransferase isoform X1 n=1 Tax=Arachis stenosperma TaxID=217475 RepID=UPI0025ACBF9B|nr:dol-P-Glc:Glc(2)Man(9)GlcNAc(2)-PP-Dol alpha-1,2-glucosyltransferase isoform X1 [Arachis stenosperma]